MQMSGTRAWLGVDVGTQGLRVAAIDDRGVPIASASRPLTSSRLPDGRHEQDAREWLSAAASVCSQVVAALGSRQVGGVAVCGTSGTIVLGTEHGDVITPALMYDDARARSVTESVRDAWRDCADRNGYTIAPTWALPKLLGLTRQLRDVDKVRVFHVPDFLGAWLAGHPVAVDYSHALKLGYDLAGLCWPAEAFERIGVPTQMLPTVVAPGTTVGHVGLAAAEVTGLPQGTPVIAGMTDGCASQIASGAIRPGQWNCALGTTFVLKGVSERLLRDPSGAVYSHRHPDGGWLPGGASSAGAGALAAAFPDADPAELDRLAEPFVPTPFIRYPLVVPGERFPFVRPDAEPFECGSASSDGERAAALLQSVPFVERLSLSYVSSLGADTSGRITLTGGGARSAIWRQIHADVLGRPVAVPAHPEAAVGMAILAAAGRGSVAEAADHMVRIAEVVDPRRKRTEKYLPIYQRMVDELERRGYIDAGLASQARAA